MDNKISVHEDICDIRLLEDPPIKK